MGLIVEEVKLWNTPLLGAYQMWMFTKGFCEHHATGDAPVGLMHFIASAVLTNSKLSERINRRRDNLQSYIKSFEDNKESDLLLSIHERVKDKKQYTIESIDIAVSEGLLVWDAQSGKIYHKNVNKKSARGKSIKGVAAESGKKAQILGKWFSEHDINSVATYLGVLL
jgi:hypothetical protein